MKTKNFWRFVLISMAAVMCVGLSSCSNNAEDELQILLSNDSSRSGNSSGNSILANSDIASPVVVNFGDSVAIELSYPSSYTDPDGTVFSCEPKAYIKVKAPKDTLYADSYEKLVYVGEKDRVSDNVVSGEVTLKKLQQTFVVGSGAYESVIIFDKGYEIVKHVNSLGETIEMPYLKAVSAKFSSVGAEERSGIETSIKPVYCARMTRADGDESNKKYDITVTFTVDLSGVNTAESVNQTLTFEIDFPGVVGTPPPPELVDVKYRKDYVWFEPHDNLPLRYYYVLFRDRYYSNGEVLTDVFHTEYTSAIESGIALQIPYNNVGVGEYRLDDGTIVIYHNKNSVSDDIYQYEGIVSSKTGVPDIEKLDTLVMADEFITFPGDWEKYYIFGPHTYYNPTNPEEGWYYRDIEYDKILNLYYDKYNLTVRIYKIAMRFYDRFCYLDGQLIDFTEFLPIYNWNFGIERITMPDGTTPAKVFTHECTMDYLGKQFHRAVIDTVYQYQTP